MVLGTVEVPVVVLRRSIPLVFDVEASCSKPHSRYVWPVVLDLLRAMEDNEEPRI